MHVCSMMTTTQLAVRGEEKEGGRAQENREEEEEEGREICILSKGGGGEGWKEGLPNYGGDDALETKDWATESTREVRTRKKRRTESGDTFFRVCDH